MRSVTFGITTFNRPTMLANLVRSIQSRYPGARIVVADNGRSRPQLPDGVRVLQLEFDCGLSRARNALVDQLETPYLLVLEDDFLFTEETRIDPLLEVLQADPEVGCVGGALRDVNGRLACYALDINVFRDRMEVREAPHRVRITPAGTPYRICDMVWNFCLFRREMLADHRWADRLKVGEHCPYFHQVKLAAKWRVAACNLAAIAHVPHRRSPGYLKYRQRAQQLFESYLAEYGIREYQRIKPFRYEDDAEDRPCIVVLGVGHSGTTVVTRMLHQAGWNAGDADANFAESVAVRRLNEGIVGRGRLELPAAERVLSQLPRPWALKDPRFARTLHHWLRCFAKLERQPLLLRIHRDRDSLMASYQRRNAPGDVEQRVDGLRSLVEQQYARWPWERMTVAYDNLAAGVQAFSMRRFQRQQRRQWRRFQQYESPAGKGDVDAALRTIAAYLQQGDLSAAATHASADSSFMSLAGFGSLLQHADGSLSNAALPDDVAAALALIAQHGQTHYSESQLAGDGSSLSRGISDAASSQLGDGSSQWGTRDGSSSIDWERLMEAWGGREQPEGSLEAGLADEFEGRDDDPQADGS